jgi:membrane protease YdiL (CAAX protease family)
MKRQLDVCIYAGDQKLIQGSFQLSIREAIGVFLLFVLMIFVGPVAINAMIEKYLVVPSEVAGINLEKMVIQGSLLSKIFIELLVMFMAVYFVHGRAFGNSVFDKIKSMGFVLPANKLWVLAFIPGGFMVLLQGLGSELFPPYEGYKGNELVGLTSIRNFETQLLLFVLIVLTGPVLEEFIFREVLFVVLRQLIGAWAGMFLCCILFVLFHYGIWSKGYWVAIFSLSVSSMFFGWIRIKSESLIPAILAHQGLNFSVLVASMYFRSV